LERLARRWHGFWFAEGPALALGLFRILFAGCLLVELGTTRVKGVNAIRGGFHLPYLERLPLVPESTYGLLHDLQYPLILLLAAGLLARSSSAILLLIQSYLFFADQLNFRNHAYLFLLLLLLLLLSPSAETFSVRGLIRARRSGRTWLADTLAVRRPLTFQRLVQVQVCLAYFFAGLHKLHPAYLRGDVLGEVLRLEAGATPPGWLLATLACLTVALELWLPVGLWVRKTRTFSILLGILFHLAIAWVLGIHAFSMAMVASYLLFLEPHALSGLFGRLSRPCADRTSSP
jgi:hypothetical protein